MGDEAQGNDRAAPLREPLRRVDAVLNFARKLVRENGEVPPGLVDDFHEARKDLEKKFVLHFQDIDDDLQKQLREFIKATRDITATQIADNVRKLSQRARGALNRLVIHGDEELSLTSEVGDVRFTDSEIGSEKPQFEPAPAAGFAPPADKPAAAPKPEAGVRRALAALVVFAVLAGVALAVGYLVGPWSSTVPVYNSANQIADANEPADNAPGEPGDNTPDPDTEPFDAKAAGYTIPIKARQLPGGMNPLEADPDNLIPDDLIRLLLGMEELAHVIEPSRLAFPPDDTRSRIERFAQGAETSAPDWIESRTPLIEAFVAHVKEELQLARYPEQSQAQKLLVSDVLYSLGGEQLPLVLTLGALAQSCDAPLRLIAPHGPERPLLSITLDDGVHTFNGESFGLRTGNQAPLLLDEMVVALARKLRPTMDTPEGRILCTAILQRFQALFTVDQAREALKDFDLRWLVPPGDEAEAREALVHDLAVRLQGPLCETLLKPIAGGDADEAMNVFRLARAAGDEERTSRALLMLGERAAPGAMIDNEPLALVVGELLLEQDKPAEADNWFKRAMDDHPEDPRPVMRLLPRRAGEARLALMREAYARGERSLGFMRLLATSVAEAGEGLAALALFDQILRRDDFEDRDLQQAVLQCLALGRTDWALGRLREHGEFVVGDAGLERLELICELSENGLSARAQDLGESLRGRGEMDAFTENLLRRHGG